MELNDRIMYTKEQLINHMENGGQIFRVSNCGKRSDKFFYKMENGELKCRCNEFGGWNHPYGGIQWGKDDLHVAEHDYEYNDYEYGNWSNPKLIIKKLPSIEETIGEEQ